MVRAQALERALDRPAGVLGRPVEDAIHRVLLGRRKADAELGGDDPVIAAPGDRLAHELLVGVGAVHLGGVEEVAAELERPVDRGEGLSLVGRAVEGGHAHAAEAEGGDGQGPQVALLHRSASLSW